MTILQPKEVMQNVEKPHKDTALTNERGRNTIFPLKRHSSDYERGQSTIFPFKRHHYVQLLQACWIPLQAPISSQTISA